LIKLLTFGSDYRLVKEPPYIHLFTFGSKGFGIKQSLFARQHQLTDQGPLVTTAKAVSSTTQKGWHFGQSVLWTAHSAV
jgi:hypothetical protein